MPNSKTTEQKHWKTVGKRWSAGLDGLQMVQSGEGQTKGILRCHMPAPYGRKECAEAQRKDVMLAKVISWVVRDEQPNEK